MRKTIITLAALLMCIAAFCQNGYKKASFTYGGVTLPYRYLEPNVKQNECIFTTVECYYGQSSTWF